MFWADKIILAAKNRFAKKISDEQELIIRDEKTCSGRVHVGSLRGIAIHGILKQIFDAEKIPAKFIFEINDFDPMDDCPPILQKTHEQFLGQPLFAVPPPENSTAKNFAEHFAAEFISVI